MQDTEADQNALLDQIASLALAGAGPEALPGLRAWVRGYYASASHDTLAARSAEDLAGMALGHLEMARRRVAGSPLVRVQPARESGLASVETCVDDMPFLVDTLVMAVRDAGGAVDWSVHPLCRVQRDAEGRLLALDDGPGAVSESWIHVEFEALPDAAAYPRLVDSVLSRLQDLRLAVADYGAMRERLQSVIDSLRAAPASSVEERDERLEAAAFLAWLDEGHFTFLASARTVFEIGADGRRKSVPRPEQGLGLARPGARFADMDALIAPREQLEKYAESPRVVVLTKAAQRATVHHPEYMDHVAVRYIAPDGKPQGVVRLIGQFSSEAYVERPWDIPLIRRKVEHVMQRSQLQPGSHSAKNLREILHALPRDELFQSSETELFETCMGIRALRDRHPLRLFLRRDRYGRFFSALVYLPRERYSRELRDRVTQELQTTFGGQSVDRSVEFMRGGLARVHVLVRTAPGTNVSVTVQEIEKRLQVLARPWRERLLEALRGAAPETGIEVETLASRFGDAFAASYTERVSPAEAATDVIHLARLSEQARVVPSLQLRGERNGRLKLYAWQQPLALADVLPVLENFGVRALRQDPEAVRPASTEVPLWIQDFEVELPAGEGADRSHDFERTLLAVLDAAVEDDALNRLVLAAGLDGRQVTCLRMLAKYVNQMGLPYGRAEIERTIAQNPTAAGLAVRWFEGRFDPDVDAGAREGIEASAREHLSTALDAVTGLDEDRILRAVMSVIGASLRTNYYQRREDGTFKDVISLKLDPRQVSELPQPRPHFEIWVYSPRMEGVHLRGGAVARGGLRWSDRREDFRTEVLGLMKAQSVKNAVIVPVGAKGGFVVKRGPPPSDREAWLRNGTECYRSFLRGLLDLTDNRVSGALVPPPRVRRVDGDDPYLVVAADKGTATFSDIANGIAQEYDFWLGDAFASGGSVGYDHKKMGITARGAWESVKRHFRELGRDIQSEPFTVVGVGDMSGDVFGNGMLLSREIRLLAAFDHRHIFVDPHPDAAAAFAERERLFALPRSSWADYDTRLLSPGGGVFPRSAKLVKLSPEVREILGVDREALPPAELIRAVLRAPVDLLWNGGIGTYVKAHDQSNEQARDRSNDAVRVDGRDVRAKVVGEGGNLGFTQAGRIEYAARGAEGRGGRINTDAIDNSGGVHSSDREVNIKIPLNLLMHEQALAREDRDRLLASMTADVAGAVLRDSEVQCGCISQIESEAAVRLDEHAALIRRFEREGRLDRALEGLPDEDEIQSRRSEGRGLMRPEIAVLVAYGKLALFEVVMESGLAEDPHFVPELLGYFPPALVERFRPSLESHLLRRELVSTILANRTVNRMGPTFVHRLAEDRGLSPGEVLKAYAAAESLFDAPRYWQAIERLPHSIAAELQYRLMLQVAALLRHVAGSIAGSASLRSLSLGPFVERYAGDVVRMQELLPQVLPRDYREDYDRSLAELLGQAVPEPLAVMLTRARALGSALDISDLASDSRLPLQEAATVYFGVGDALRLPWILSAIIRLKAANPWQALARARLREDAYRLHRQIASRVLAVQDVPPAARFERWAEHHGARLRLSLARLAELQSSAAVDFAGLAVAVRELHDLQAL